MNNEESSWIISLNELDNVQYIKIPQILPGCNLIYKKVKWKVKKSIFPVTYHNPQCIHKNPEYILVIIHTFASVAFIQVLFTTKLNSFTTLLISFTTQAGLIYKQAYLIYNQAYLSHLQPGLSHLQPKLNVRYQLSSFTSVNITKKVSILHIPWWERRFN